MYVEYPLGLDRVQMRLFYFITKVYKIFNAILKYNKKYRKITAILLSQPKMKS